MATPKIGENRRVPSDDQIRYPIGLFKFGQQYSDEERRLFITQLAQAPANLRAALRDLSDHQLDTPYREGGWSIRQVVHHLPDGQLQWYNQAKRALTEDESTMSPFDPARWANLPDAKSGAVELSLRLFDGLQTRLALFFDSLSPVDVERTFRTARGSTMKIADILPVLAWHARHHTAHITELRLRKGWFKPE
jgi:uncharacterized damage-inducible protein DinB